MTVHTKAELLQDQITALCETVNRLQQQIDALVERIEALEAGKADKPQTFGEEGVHG